MALKDMKVGDSLDGLKVGDRETTKTIVKDQEGNDTVAIAISEIQIITQYTTAEGIQSARAYEEKQIAELQKKVAIYTSDIDAAAKVIDPVIGAKATK